MSVSLFDVSAVSYLQVLNAVAGFLDKGRSHFAETDVDLSDIVSFRLIDDMSPFQFQIISVAHHSMGALKALESGEFTPPIGYGEPDYEGLQALIQQAIETTSAADRDAIDQCVGKKLIFKIGDNEVPFTAENFVNSFSLPNFYFHAATAYDMLRMKGVPLGKLDFIGSLRMGA
ncbi:MAG: hypothetical protein ACI8Z1_002009 [Candidatus Azotimanducaceae bacterium]|jgi:hypothetical protein